MNDAQLNQMMQQSSMAAPPVLTNGYGSVPAPMPQFPYPLPQFPYPTPTGAQ